MEVLVGRRRAAAALAVASLAPLALVVLALAPADGPPAGEAPAPVARARVAPPAPPASRQVAVALAPSSPAPTPAAGQPAPPTPPAPPPPAPPPPPSPGPTTRAQGPCPVDARPFLDAQGLPMRRVRLGCDPAGDVYRHEHGEEQPAEPFEVELDAEGRPALDGLPPGRWALHVLERRPGERPGEELRGWILEVEARPGVPVRVALDAGGPRGRVEGLLRGAPRDELAQVELRPLDEPTETFRFAAARRVDADGRFAFDAVPPGRYDVVASWDAGEARGAVEVPPGGAPAWIDLAP